MQILIGFVFLVGLFVTPAAKAEGNSAIILDMNYHEARKIILENGWRPANGLSPREEIGAMAKDLRDLGYAEVDDCAGSGTAPCMFYFQNDKGEYLHIGTDGEDNGHSTSFRVRYAAIRNQMD